MANKKGKNNQDSPDHEDPEDHTEEICKKVMEKITETFDERFTRLEQAMHKMAATTEAQAQATKQRKRPAPQDSQPMDTRNKALRVKYNPQMVEPSVSFNQNEPVEVIEEEPESTDAMDEQGGRQSLQQASTAQAQPKGQQLGFRPAFKNGIQTGFSSHGNDPNFEVNQWLIKPSQARISR